MTADPRPADPAYIVRRAGRDGATRYVQVGRLVARRVEINKPTGKTLGGLFTEVKGTGRYRPDVLCLHATRDETVDGFGRRAYDGLREHVGRSAAGVKAVVRRIRPQEAAELARIDEDIAEVQERLETLRRQRREALASAWQRAHVVRLADVEALVDLPWKAEP